MPSNQNLPLASGPAAPDAVLFQVTSSESLPASERYEHWLQSQLIGVRALAPSARQRRDFRGWIMSLTSPEFEIHEADLDDFEAERSARQMRLDADDSLALMFVMRGGLYTRYPDGRCAGALAGQFLMFDARRAYRLRMEGARVMQLTLPPPARRLLPASSLMDDAVRAMARHPLSRLLALQLREYRELVQALDGPGRAALLDATSALAMTVLRAACAAPAEAARRPAHLHAAAQAYIQRHLDDPGLNARSLARALGCGRSALYLAFAAQGQGVAETIREARLQAVARLLRQGDAAASIADLAHQCGLQDPSNFSRMFRRRFQMAPQAFRSLHRGRAG